jgi:hypothetical protein
MKYGAKHESPTTAIESNLSFNSGFVDTYKESGWGERTVEMCVAAPGTLIQQWFQGADSWNPPHPQTPFPCLLGRAKPIGALVCGSNAKSQSADDAATRNLRGVYWRFCRVAGPTWISGSTFIGTRSMFQHTLDRYDLGRNP